MQHTPSPDGPEIINDCPYPSWTEDSETGFWIPPVERPNDGLFYAWDEASLSWVVPEPDATAE